MSKSEHFESWYNDNVKGLDDTEKRELGVELALGFSKAIQKGAEMHVEWLKNLATLSSAGMLATATLMGTVIASPGIAAKLALFLFSGALLCSVLGMKFGIDRVEEILRYQGTKLLWDLRFDRTFPATIGLSVGMFILAVLTLACAF